MFSVDRERIDNSENHITEIHSEGDGMPGQNPGLAAVYGSHDPKNESSNFATDFCSDTLFVHTGSNSPDLEGNF